MARLEFIKNHPATLVFVEATGRLMLNLGYIEFLSYEWIGELQSDSMVTVLARRAKLRSRIDIVRKMIQRTDRLTEEAKNGYLDLWSEVLPHAEIRNIVAHNAVGMGFVEDNPAEETTAIGVMNLHPRDKNRDAELVSVEEINGSVNATARIAGALHDGLKSLSGQPSPNKRIERMATGAD